ncbi:hypothetical protein [Bradyrhizobium sacchari]|uniref:hypothetical protein n=1 Tax=Bradyrhizobium sacchari TaxID=1399419 RepID=UPI0010A978E4|nr:hypothetical protein [Bradyrhizobium sacchari]
MSVDERQRPRHVGDCSGLSRALDVGERKSEFISEFAVVVAFGQFFEDEAGSIFSLPSEHPRSDVAASDLPVRGAAIRRNRYRNGR